MSYDVKTLEFDKILECVAQYTRWSNTKDYILNLTPTSDLEELNRMQTEEKEASAAIVKYDDLPLLDLSNIVDVLKRIEIGGVITNEE